MKYLSEEKQPKPYYTNRHRFFGEINIADGLVDITDPCYDKGTWCAMFGYKIKPGKYKCYVDVANFPSKYMYEKDDPEVVAGIKKVNQVVTRQDRRIIALTIEHNEANNIPYNELKEWEKVTDKIGVDAGMCGFYNHKPSFKDDDKWDDFWQNANNLPRYRWLTCDIKPYGATVSSGFGDGLYPLFEYKQNGETVALQLLFD